MRVRVEWDDIRRSLVKGMLPSTENYVSCAKRIDFQVAKYATQGMHEYSQFSMKTFTSHIEELQSYEKVLPYIINGLMTVWLWRGHYPIKIRNKTIKLPIHSVTAFVWGISIAWNSDLIPSFLLFLIGWIFLACGEQVRQHPSPWHQTIGFTTYLNALIFGRKATATIKRNENLPEAKAYEAELVAAEERLIKERELEAKEEQELQAQYGAEIEDAQAADVDISSSGGGFGVSINPLKPILHPIQLILGEVVVYLRIISSIVAWEESYFAFWISLSCFVASLAICWVPWGFLITWLFRIVIVVALGPWMALVDYYYFREDPKMSDHDRSKARRERIKGRYAAVMTAATNFQIRKERALKLKSMKKYMFGRFLLRVPRFMEDAVVDYPLPESHAEPWKETKKIVLTGRKYGQALKGDMIPVREIQDEGRPKTAKKGRFWRPGTKLGAIVGSKTEKDPLLGGSEKMYESTK